MSVARTAGIGALLVALGPLSMALYTPAMPTLVAHFGSDAATVQATLTIYFAGFAFAQLVCGPLSDAFGRKPVVLAFVGLYLVASILALAAPNVHWLLAARALQGIGAATGVAISRAVVRDLYTGAESVRIMNLIGIMLGVGPALAPTIGGLMLELFDWHAIFLLMIAYGAILVAILVTLLPETCRYRDTARARPARLAANYAALACDPRFVRPAVTMGFTLGLIYSLATMLPFVMIEVVGLTPTQFGLSMIAQSGSFILGSLVMNAALKRVDGARLLPIGIGLVAFAGLVMALIHHVVAPSAASVMGPIAFVAFGVPFLMPHLTTQALAPFPHMAGAAAALMGFVQMGSGLAGSFAAVLVPDPIVALGLVGPGMAAVSLATFFGLRRAAAARTRLEAACDAPAE